MLWKGADFAGYRVDRVMRTGPRGTEYLAHHRDLAGDAVLTVIDADLFGDSAFRERFIREADAAGEMTHPNIASVHGHGITDDGVAWIATANIGGTDAETALREGQMTPAKAVRIASEVARALDYAHRHGLVHRDVRPSNFLLSSEDPDKYVVLSSFGNALPAEYVDPATLLSAVTYAAPEVLSGAPVDGRADLYSLGGSLFRLLTGRTPFPPADDPATAVQQHLQEPPPKVTDNNPKLPPALNAVISIAMAKDPDARYQTGEAFAAALISILPRPSFPAAGPLVPTPPPPPLFPPYSAAPVGIPTPSPEPTPPSVPEPASSPHQTPAIPPCPPSQPTPPPINWESRPPSAYTPSWHPDAGIEPSEAGTYSGAVLEINSTSRRPLMLGAALVVASALVLGGVVWLTSRHHSPTAAVAQPSGGSTNPSVSTTPRSTTPTSPAPATRNAAAETTLRGLLPAGYPPDACVPADPRDGARATFTCAANVDPGGPPSARYSLMPSADALQRAFNKLASESSTVICPGNIMSPGAWRYNATPEVVAGTVLCAERGSEQLVAWTADDKLLLSVARSTDGGPTLGQLFAWWGTHS